MLYGDGAWKTRGHYVTLLSRKRPQIPSIIKKISEEFLMIF
jgi:hypothetical protein